MSADYETSKLYRDEALSYRLERLYGQPTHLHAFSRRFVIFIVGISLLVFVIGITIPTFVPKFVVRGELRPAQGLPLVSAPASGVVAELFVQEGKTVKEGDLLAVVSSEVTVGNNIPTRETAVRELAKQRALIEGAIGDADRAYEIEKRALEGQLTREKADLTNIDRQIQLQRKRRELAEQDKLLYQQLGHQGFFGESLVRRKIDAELEQQLSVLALTRSKEAHVRRISSVELDIERATATHNAKLTDLRNSQSSIERALAEGEAHRRWNILAQTTGVVSGLSVAVGQSVAANETVATIVPQGASLQAVLFVPSRAVAYVTRGTRIQLRYDAFPYQKFGHYGGTVWSISESIAPPLNKTSQVTDPHYLVTVLLDSQWVEVGDARLPLRSGMGLNAAIPIERTGVWQQIFDPIAKALRA